MTKTTRVKIALFRHLMYDWTAVYTEDQATSIDRYYRTTEWVEVDLPARSPDEYIPDVLQSLNKERNEEQAKHLTRLKELADIEGKFLALSYAPASPPQAGAETEGNANEDWI